MFVGAINSKVREFLGNRASVFNDKRVVVGCSGNFTSEAVVSRYATARSVHSNDVSFYSCMAGRWLSGRGLDFEIGCAEFEWLKAYQREGETKGLAAVMVLLDMLPFEKQNNAHKKRMWGLYMDKFQELVEETVERLKGVQEAVRVDEFFEGDVFDHFERFGDDPEAVFCCYAPTYAGGYEKLYRRVEEIFRWDKPNYELLDEERRDKLLRWMSERDYLWYDDRVLDGFQPVMKQRGGRSRTVYLYSNIVRGPAYFDDRQPGDLPKLPLAGQSLEIRPTSRIGVVQIKTNELRRYKDAFLGKHINFGAGMWAFAVFVEDYVVGFFEFMPGFTREAVYMIADFAVAGTRYKRLSKLVVMVAVSGQTRRMVEKLAQIRKRRLSTTAFTDRPVSMKYRGVLQLSKRGETEQGEKYLQYEAEFNNSSWEEALKEWMRKHA